jgi:hypothetical protein
MRQAMRAYRSLSDEQRNILEQKVVKVQRKPAEAIALLKGIADCDKLVGSSGTSAGCSLAVAIVVGLIAVFVSVAQPLIGVPLLLICIVAAIWTGRVYRWTKKVDVSDNLRTFALPVLTVFADDFDPEEPLQLDFDLRSPTDPAKKRETMPEQKVGCA